MRFPITLRIMFHGLRSFWVAGIMAVVAWVFLASASPQERSILNASAGTQRPDGLVTMRVARAIVYVAPDRAARMLSLASGGEFSVEAASAILDGIANGTTTKGARIDQTTPSLPVDEQTMRMAGGAKFVQVDQP